MEVKGAPKYPTTKWSEERGGLKEIINRWQEIFTNKKDHSIKSTSDRKYFSALIPLNYIHFQDKNKYCRATRIS